ncbi:hypothetical protein [Nocardiopsis baichengensis]|uniref:hypothetical protein n=1 Tax=Nocardiopsis baichengensis TaxID=280240 RepID=UPI001268B068|nr:hypothetical protein [Nocardiopsis baichengensis]
MVDVLEIDESVDVSEGWNDRIEECYARGMPALEAFDHLSRLPADSMLGGVEPTSERGERASLEEFHLEVTGRRLPEQRRVPVGYFEDGTPLDRAYGWGDLSPFTLSTKTYNAAGSHPVHYLPVEMNENVIGYLWASDADWAAGFVWVSRWSEFGFPAAGLWDEWLVDCYSAGMGPLDAMRAARNAPFEAKRGRVVPGSEEKTVGAFHELRKLAARGNG